MTAPAADRGHGRDRVLFALLVVLVAVPFVVALVSAIGSHWNPSGDDALEVLRIRDVGSHHTPLLGAWSRWRWSHPGPALFWTLAPFDRVLGNDGVLMGTALIGGASAIATLFVARVIAGLRFAAVAAIGVAFLAHGLGSATLFDPWNPSVALFPYLLTVVLVAGSVSGRPRMLPAAVVVGSFVVQTHAGYSALVGALLIVGMIVAVIQARRVALVAVTLGGLVWLPAIIEQFRDQPGNLGLLLRYGRSSTEPTAGWSVALRTMSAHLRPFGPWIGNHEYLPSGVERTASPVAGVVVLLALALLGVLAWRRGRRVPAIVAGVVLGSVGLALLSSARITGLYVPYILGFWRVVAALVWIAIAWIASELVWPRSERATVGVEVVAMVTAAVVAGLAIVHAPAPVPYAALSRDVAHVGPHTLLAVPRTGLVLVTGEDPTLVDASASALFTYLEPHRSNVRVTGGPNRDRQYGHWRLIDPAHAAVEISMSTKPGADPDWSPPPGSQVVARWDALTPGQRRRARILQRRVAAAVGAAPHEVVLVDTGPARAKAVARGARRPDVDELARLLAIGDLAVVTRSTPAGARGSGV